MAKKFITLSIEIMMQMTVGMSGVAQGNSNVNGVDDVRLR